MSKIAFIPDTERNCTRLPSSVYLSLHFPPTVQWQKIRFGFLTLFCRCEQDWDEREEIDDPEDKKPDGYDDIPKQIVDPDASKPDDWDDDSDGEWEAPMIDNPEYKGEWKPKRIANTAYKGKWVAPDIENPKFQDDKELYNVVKSNSLVGFELWQVKAGTIFDNILVCDDPAYAKAKAEKVSFQP